MHQLIGVYKIKGMLLVSLLAESTPSGGGDSNNVKIALISAFGIVLAAAITAIFATFKKDAPNIIQAPMPSTVTDYIAELVRRATDAEHRAEIAESSISAKDRIIQQSGDEVDRLTRLLLIARIDPATGKPLGGSNAN